MLKTIVIQGVGALTSILLTGVISRKTGIDGQGYWAELKANTEFLAAFLAFGFPSSVTYLIHAKGQSVKRILKSIFACVGIASCIGVFCGFVYFKIFNKLIIGNSTQDAVIIYASAVLLSIYFIYRGIYLALSTNTGFDVVTASLPIFLLVSFWVSDINFKEDIYSIYLVAILLLTATIGIPWHLFFFNNSNNIASTHQVKELSFWQIVMLSAPNFGTIILPYLFPLLLYKTMRMNGYSEYEMGIISICMLVQGAALLIPNIIGPRLYKEWTIMDAKIDVRMSYKKAVRYTYLFSLIVFLVTMGGIDVILTLVTGGKLHDAIAPIFIILSTLPLSAALRPMLNLCLSRGGANHYIFSLIIKSLSLVVLFSFFPKLGVISAAFIIMFTEVIAFVVLLFMSKKLLKWSYPSLLGVQ
ncbi:hypothetical protein [Limnohabitans sp. B9-3]|uniref:hypothetical protein n=1 Tax=Limnohabitans sp. B9-3 TaxID=1100707 RepID=UPI000C1EC41A|nr:hypothetical protein [Limnohabitans sp. B9-3]PIT72397.1 hypothetical protein B9Z42_12670 [Limnohabitans sp. B9-3]